MVDGRDTDADYRNRDRKRLVGQGHEDGGTFRNSVAADNGVQGAGLRLRQAAKQRCDHRSDEERA